MRLPTFLALACVISTLPAFGANCGNYTASGNSCVRSVVLGWGVAGGGAQSVITFLTGTASAPVSFAVSRLNSSLGTSYTGYFGISESLNGAPSTVVNASGFGSLSLAAGLGAQITVSQTCFDSTCTVATPAAFTGPFLPNMFSVLMTITAASGADLDATPLPLLTVQFLVSNGLVTFQEQEQAVDASAVRMISAATLDEGASAATRYVYTGNAVNLPYTAFSVSNPSLTTTASISMAVNDSSGNRVANVTLPPIPPQGAVGYLLVGRNSSDTLGLLPSGTTLPAGADGIFHGTYGIISASVPVVFLSQEFYGSSMLNAFIVP